MNSDKYFISFIQKKSNSACEDSSVWANINLIEFKYYFLLKKTYIFGPL